MYKTVINIMAMRVECLRYTVFLYCGITGPTEPIELPVCIYFDSFDVSPNQPKLTL